MPQNHRPTRMIDLSVRTGPTPSEATPVDIVTTAHEDAPAIFGLTGDDFPDGMGVSTETVTLTTHTGTHMDAPLHYGPRTGDAPARSIDEVPLEWCLGPGLRLDVRHVPTGGEIGIDDVCAALDAASHELAPGEIVMLWTGADALWGTADYLSTYPGLSGTATRYLVENGIRVIGIDAWGLDRPIPAMLEDYRRTHDRDTLWPAHHFGREQEYLQLEKLAGLGQLPAADGFTVACFPVAVAGARCGVDPCRGLGLTPAMSTSSAVAADRPPGSASMRRRCRDGGLGSDAPRRCAASRSRPRSGTGPVHVPSGTPCCGRPRRPWSKRTNVVSTDCPGATCGSMRAAEPLACPTTRPRGSCTGAAGATTRSRWPRTDPPPYGSR